MASRAMDKANAAVDQLVKTTQELRETRAELSATIDELRMTKLDLGKTKEALESTSAELAKAKKELKASSERVFALEEQMAHVSAELESTTANLTEMTKSRDEEREDDSPHRWRKRVSHAQGQTPGGGGAAVEELEDALEDLQTAKDGRAAANATAAQAKIRLGLLRRERSERGEPTRARRTATVRVGRENHGRHAGRSRAVPKDARGGVPQSVRRAEEGSRQANVTSERDERRRRFRRARRRRERASEGDL